MNGEERQSDELYFGHAEIKVSLEHIACCIYSSRAMKKDQDEITDLRILSSWVVGKL